MPIDNNKSLLINNAYEEYKNRPLDFPDGFNESFSLKHAWQTGFMLGLKLADLPYSSLYDNTYENYRDEHAGRAPIYAWRLEEYFKEGCFKALNYCNTNSQGGT